MKEIPLAKLDKLRGNLTQKEFAERLETPLSTYTNWISGKSQANSQAIITICKKLKISADMAAENTKPYNVTSNKSKKA